MLVALFMKKTCFKAKRVEIFNEITKKQEAGGRFAKTIGALSFFLRKFKKPQFYRTSLFLT
jgi:hypothetical protein